MAKRESLKMYQDSILEKMEAARMADAGQTNLLFGFNAGTRNFLISGKDVSELTSPSTLEPIPVSKPWAAGVANIKGSVHSVTDFSVLTGGEPIKRGKFMVFEPHVIVGSALLITRMTGLHELADVGTAIDAPEMKAMPNWITSCYEMNGEKYYMVDAALLASDERFSKLQSGEI
jgi:twitching motility protein PilI